MFFFLFIFCCCLYILICKTRKVDDIYKQMSQRYKGTCKKEIISGKNIPYDSLPCFLHTGTKLLLSSLLTLWQWRTKKQENIEKQRSKKVDVSWDDGQHTGDGPIENGRDQQHIVAHFRCTLTWHNKPINFPQVRSNARASGAIICATRVSDEESTSGSGGAGLTWPNSTWLPSPAVELMPPSLPIASEDTAASDSEETPNRA